DVTIDTKAGVAPPERRRLMPHNPQSVGPLPFETLDKLLGIKAKADVACPECGPRCTTKVNAKKPVLAIWRKDESFLTYNCARCGVHGFAHEHNSDWRKRIPPDLPKRAVPNLVPDVHDDEERNRLECAHSLFRAAKALKDTPGETYF